MPNLGACDVDRVERTRDRIARRRRPTVHDFVEYRRTRDPRRRDRIVEGHAGLAYAIARSFADGRAELEDLEQVALLALVEAIERFDPSLGIAFSTFATPTISGNLKRYFRDRTWALRPPRSVQERYLEVNATVERLTGCLRRLPTLDEVAADGSWSVGDVREAMQAGQVHRRHETLGGLDADTAVELAMIDDELADVELRLITDRLLECLAENERKVVEMRFYDDLAQSAIGRRLGVSQMTVSRLLAAALARLRGAATDPALSHH